ncbi:hypothetical protein EU642_21760, partial [Salmonella enterica]|nr:hypothetical protein [Salmonella enterica]EAV1285242.1 hypothetical protein [Salmonella enterica]
MGYLTRDYLAAEFSCDVRVTNTANTGIDRRNALTAFTATLLVANTTAADDRNIPTRDRVPTICAFPVRLAIVLVTHHAAKTFTADVVLNHPKCQVLFF